MSGDIHIYMEARARIANIPLKQFSCMPFGELSDQLDAYSILQGYADECVINDKNIFRI